MATPPPDLPDDLLAALAPARRPAPPGRALRRARTWGIICLLAWLAGGVLLATAGPEPLSPFARLLLLANALLAAVSGAAASVWGRRVRPATTETRIWTFLGYLSSLTSFAAIPFAMICSVHPSLWPGIVELAGFLDIYSD